MLYHFLVDCTCPSRASETTTETCHFIDNIVIATIPGANVSLPWVCKEVSGNMG